MGGKAKAPDGYQEFEGDLRRTSVQTATCRVMAADAEHAHHLALAKVGSLKFGAAESMDDVAQVRATGDGLAQEPSMRVLFEVVPAHPRGATRVVALGLDVTRRMVEQWERHAPRFGDGRSETRFLVREALVYCDRECASQMDIERLEVCVSQDDLWIAGREGGSFEIFITRSVSRQGLIMALDVGYPEVAISDDDAALIDRIDASGAFVAGHVLPTHDVQPRERMH